MILHSEKTVGRKPLVSLIVGGRNDSYMGDFKWRFAAAINFLCQSLKEIGRIGDLELVVCDWNSDVPLHTVLRLCPEARDVVRFIVVPPAVARPILAAKECEFPIPIVQNIAIRRSLGTFIGQTDSDVLYTTSTLLALFNVLEGHVPHVPFNAAFMTGGRRHLPLPQILSQPSYCDLRDYVLRNGFLLMPEKPQAGSAAPTSLVMMHRDVWHACHGYDERWVHWGWMDLDLALRATQRVPIVHLDNFGLNLIHLEHYVVRDYDPKKHFRRTNRSDDDPAFVANDEQWGLADVAIEEHVVTDVDPECCDEKASGSRASVGRSLTPENIGLELADEQVSLAVKAVIEGAGAPIDAYEPEALSLLAWSAQRLLPRVFVESGMRYAHAASLVSRACPGVEVYGLVNWKRPGPDEHLFERRDDACLTFWASNMLTGFGNLHSYSRFVGGEPETAFQRLRESMPTTFSWQVALVRTSPCAERHARELVESARDSAAMIITGPEAATATALARTVASLSANSFLIQTERGNSHVVLLNMNRTP